MRRLERFLKDLPMGLAMGGSMGVPMEVLMGGSKRGS